MQIAKNVNGKLKMETNNQRKLKDDLRIELKNAANALTARVQLRIGRVTSTVGKKG